MLRPIAAKLPSWAQDEVRRLYYRRQIKAGGFRPTDPEIRYVTESIRPGDIVVDIGANIGYYTLHLSECVGATGRVISLEPMPQTFGVLSANIRSASALNVTLVNMAASSRFGFVSMLLPKFANGLDNHYCASISESGSFKVMCMPLDSLELSAVRFIKIDAEGHNCEALTGARRTIERCRPMMVIEQGTDDDRCFAWLKSNGYQYTNISGSSNMLAEPVG